MGLPNSALPERIENDFAYHQPSSAAVGDRHSEIRAKLKEVAAWIERAIPPGREQALTLTKLEEAMFWANAAVARTQKAP